MIALRPAEVVKHLAAPVVHGTWLEKTFTTKGTKVHEGKEKNGGKTKPANFLNLIFPGFP
jgi:hypothetical protein